MGTPEQRWPVGASWSSAARPGPDGPSKLSVARAAQRAWHQVMAAVVLRVEPLEARGSRAPPGWSSQRGGLSRTSTRCLPGPSAFPGTSRNFPRKLGVYVGKESQPSAPVPVPSLPGGPRGLPLPAARLPLTWCRMQLPIPSSSPSSVPPSPPTAAGSKRAALLLSPFPPDPCAVHASSAGLMGHRL